MSISRLIRCSYYNNYPHFRTNKLLPRINYNYFSCQSHHHNKDPNLVDDIRLKTEDGVNSVRPPAEMTPSAEDGGARGTSDAMAETAGYVAEAAKQGTVKAMEMGLNVGEMAKKTLDNVWDATKDTTHKVKEAVAGEGEERGYGHDNVLPPTDHFVDDLRNRAHGYDLKNK